MNSPQIGEKCFVVVVTPEQIVARRAVGDRDLGSRDLEWQVQGESFLGRKWLIGKKIKKELDKPEGISHAKMV